MKKLPRINSKMRHYFPTGHELRQQIFWLENYLLPFQFTLSIGYWNKHRRQYHKIEKIKKHIAEASLL